MPQVLAMGERHLGSWPKRAGGIRAAQGYGTTCLGTSNTWACPDWTFGITLLILGVVRWSCWPSCSLHLTQTYSSSRLQGMALLWGHSLLRAVQPKGNISNHFQLNRMEHNLKETWQQIAVGIWISFTTSWFKIHCLIARTNFRSAATLGSFLAANPPPRCFHLVTMALWVAMSVTLLSLGVLAQFTGVLVWYSFMMFYVFNSRNSQGISHTIVPCGHVSDQRNMPACKMRGLVG